MTQQNGPHTPTSTPESATPHLGLAGMMARAFIHSPLSLLFYVAMLVMGSLGYIMTPRQEDPQISVPMVDIFIRYSGASAEQVASLAIEPLQRIISEIPEVKHVYAFSEHGQGMVTVQFRVGQELEKSVFKVHDKLQSNLHKIPPGVSPPMVKPKGIDDVPVVALTLWSEDVDDGALRTLAFDVLQRIKEIPNTGQGFVVGGRSEQVRVEVMPERLAGYEISLQQVANTIRTANSEKSAGTIVSENSHFTVYTGSFLRTQEDIGRLVAGSYEGQPVYVRDVAKIFQGPEEVNKITNYYSGPAYRYDTDETGDPAHKITAMPAVTIAMAKKIGSNGVDVVRDILAKVEELKGAIPVIPENVHVEVTRNYGKTAKDKVDSLMLKLLIATGAVSILILFSLGGGIFRPSFSLLTGLGLRAAAVVTLVIPVVILITVFSAWLLGFTIDRVSLFALIFSIGILVDDAIVVIENIYRRWLLRGETDTATAVDAVREVGNPTVLATFTVVAALLPMGFVSGMMGPYMMPIPVLGSVAMIFSLFAAFIFTPWLAMALKPSLARLNEAERREHTFNERLESFFRWLLTPLVSSRMKGGLFILCLIAAFILALSRFYTENVEVKMLPLDNKPEFNVFINMPEGTALAVTANLAHQRTEKMREIQEVTALQTYVGASQPYDFNGMVRHYYLRNKPWQGDIHVQLMDKTDRERSSHEIATQARRMLAELIKDTRAKITVVEMPPGPPVLQTIVAEVYGPDDRTRREVAQKMTEFFENSEILGDVDNYMSEPHNVWRFEVDTEKAVRRGISVDSINRNLSMALGGYKLGDVKQGTVLEPTYIVIQVPMNVRAQLSRLYDLPIPTQDMRGSMPLMELGRFVEEPEEPVIFHKDLRRMEYVVGDSVGIYEGDGKYRLSSAIYGMLEIEEQLKNYRTPDGVILTDDKLRRYYGSPDINGRSGFEWTGEWTVTYETFRDMGLAFMAAMVLIYILVVWEFGNFIVPAIIMLPIPLTLLGIIPGHEYLDAEFTATSMIGWIALAGIIVRNSILLVDYSIHEVQRGTDIRDAVILACKTRTRPIMITAFALVAGSMVIITDPIFQGMAISLLCGVLVSTVLTLVVIPLGCILIGVKRLCPEHYQDEETCPAGPDVSLLQQPKQARPPIQKPPLALRIWGKFIEVATVIFFVIRAIVVMIGMGLKAISQYFARHDSVPPRPAPPQPVQPQPAPPQEPAAEKPVPAPRQDEAVPATEKTTAATEKSGGSRDESVPAAVPRQDEPVTEKTDAAPAEPSVEDDDTKEKASAARKTAKKPAKPRKKKSDSAKKKISVKQTADDTEPPAKPLRGIRLKTMSPASSFETEFDTETEQEEEKPK
ncbi:MAG: MMPL family transporter [Gammaproteobacteria bacterium]|nr:MMPL family transporter [Gammaproteobacteria bacterium]